MPAMTKRLWRSHAPRWMLGVVVLSTLYFLLASSEAAASLSLTNTVSPNYVPFGGAVTYAIDIVNNGDSAVTGLSVVNTLPPTFTYVSGSSRLYRDGLSLSIGNPSISGSNLTWNGIAAPAARTENHFGMHTFIQDACNDEDMSFQLDQTLQLASFGGWVKQMFYKITAATPGPLGCWIDFVNDAYDRDLKPVIRLGGTNNNGVWDKPVPDSPGNYSSIAAAYRRVVAGLPRRPGRKLYIEIWNEPNLNIEWSNRPSPIEYGQFLRDVSAAIRSIGDPRIVILNGGLAPGGDYNNLGFIDAMSAVPGAMQAFDLWASHPYPANHPPQYNNHDGTATYPVLTIDSYILELQKLAKYGRADVGVLLTETGYDLGNSFYAWEGYPVIDEANRADYIMRAYRDYWRQWPEVMGVMPFFLTDPNRAWPQWHWLYPSGGRHQQYDAVLTLNRKAYFLPSKMSLTFQARAGSSTGAFSNNVSLSGAGVALATGPTATVYVNVQPPPATSTPTATATPPPPAPTSTPPPVPCLPTVNKTIAVGGQPKGLAAGKGLVYVGLNNLPQVAVLDAGTGTYLGTFQTGDSTGVRHANGVAYAQQKVFVANQDSGSLSIIDSLNGQLLTKMSIGLSPLGVAASQNRVVVALYGANQLAVFDAIANALLTKVNTGTGPAFVAMTSNSVYVSEYKSGTLSGVREFDLNGQPIAFIQTGNGPFGVAVDEPSARLFVTHRADRTLAEVNLATRAVSRSVALPFLPHAVAYNPNSRHLFIVAADTNEVRVYDADTLQPLTALPIGVQNADEGGQGIALAGNWVFIGNYAGSSVTVVNDGPCGQTDIVPTPLPTFTPTPPSTPTASCRYCLWFPILASTRRTSEASESAVQLNTKEDSISLSGTKRVTVRTGRAPFLYAEDRTANLLYVGSGGGDGIVVHRLDTAEELWRMPLPGLNLPVALAVDETNHRLFALYALSPKYRNVEVIDGQTGSVLMTLRGNYERPLAEVSALAFDPARRRLLLRGIERDLLFDADNLQLVNE